MLNSKEIQQVKFSKSMSGYKQEEVDVLLDKIVEDYNQFETLIRTQQNKIDALQKELTDKDSSMESINTVLISAQKLADSITADAKKQAEDIVNNANTEAEQIKQRTKKALEEIDAVITEQKNQAQGEVDKMLAEAARKSEGMILAAKDSVAREQILFDKLKLEVAEFKKKIKNLYKEHLETLSALPEEVPLNAESAAAAVEDIINKEPDLLKFIERSDLPAAAAEPETEQPSVSEPEPPEEEAPPADLEAVKSDVSAGFVVKPIAFDEETEDKAEDEGEKLTFSKGFFGKQK